MNETIEDYKIELRFIDRETLERFWGKSQQLLEECAVTITPNKLANNIIMDDVDENI